MDTQLYPVHAHRRPEEKITQSAVSGPSSAHLPEKGPSKNNHLYHNSLTSAILCFTPTRVISLSHTSPWPTCWVVTLHYLLCNRTHPYPVTRLSSGLDHFPSQAFTPMNNLTFHTYPPMKMEQTKCSETSAYKIQTMVNYPEERIRLPKKKMSAASNPT
jgi:hypothetical protein